MNILQINSTVNTGSTGRIAEGIGLQMMKARYQSTIAYGRQKNPSESKTIRIGNKWDIYTHGLKTLLFDRHGFGSRKATKDLITKIKEVEPDVIGLHNLHGYYLHVEVLFKALQRWNIPVIWTFHDCWPFTGHCSHFERVECGKWKTHCQECPLTYAYPKSLVDKSYRNFTLKRACFTGLENLTIVTPSKWLANLVRQSFLQEYPVRVIYNGVDTQVFSPENRSTKKKLVLGVASVWTPFKGYSDFIKLRDSLPDDWEVVLIGLSDQQIKNLPAGIQGIKKTSNLDELVTWYREAAIFVNPTYSDNFPTTNIEALACGTPVVTYKTGGSPEAVDKMTGRVVEQGDIQGLVNAIKELAAHDQKKLARACRERAERLFNKKDRYQEYVTLYESLVNGRV